MSFIYFFGGDEDEDADDNYYHSDSDYYDSDGADFGDDDHGSVAGFDDAVATRMMVVLNDGDGDADADTGFDHDDQYKDVYG